MAVGDTSVKLNQISFLNTLDKYTCNSINNPLLTRTPTHMYPIQYPPKSSPCHDSLYPYPEILEGSQIVISHRVNFYPMLRLRIGDYVLSEEDTCCVGDTITVESEISGDWYPDGGPYDCPPIVWVKPEKIEQMIDKYLQFYEFRDNWDCPLTDETLYDYLTGTEIHKFLGIRNCVPQIYG
ncbi:MAG: hypothetical protein KAU03_00145, partial [Candidatus Altiarchaeales archaeon]|nr:hypothetical protein [Candidatus Altiarchaeales archaeon]